MLGVDLPELPAAGQHGGHPLLEFDLVHRLERVGLAVGGRIGVEHRREVRGRLGGGDHRQRVAAELREERQGGCDVRDAAPLPRPVGPEVVQDGAGRVSVVVSNGVPRPVAGVVPQHVVRHRQPAGVENDAVDIGHCLTGGRAPEPRRADLIGLEQTKVELDRRVEPGAGGQ